MKLSGEELKRLHEALLEAFPDRNSLRQMLLFEVNRDLEVVAPDGALHDVVFALILRAQRDNWLRDLITGAHAGNRSSPRLAAFHASFVALPGGGKESIEIQDAARRAHAEPRDLKFEEKNELARALLQCRSLQNPQRRTTVLNQLSFADTIDFDPGAAAHVFNVVEAALEEDSRVAELVRVVRAFERNTRAMQELDACVQRLMPHTTNDGCA